MGILERFSDIIKANVNDMLDKAENPSKMVDQYLRDLTKSLAEVKQETAGVMAEETRTKRMLDDNEKEVQRYESLAKKALSAGNEDDARTFLTKKQQLDSKHDSLAQTYAAARENALKMREMHDKLVSDIETLNARRDSIKAKVSVARTQEKVNRVASSADKSAGVLSAFDRMERRADDMLDRANAMETLNSQPADPTAELEKKYNDGAQSSEVDAELERLKKEMGL